MTLEIARLRGDFTAASSDGTVTEAEAKRIIRRVRENRLHESEVKAYRSELKEHRDFFDPGAIKAFDDFGRIIRRNTFLDDGPRPNPGGLLDPAVLPTDIDRLEQQMVKNGELFRNGISAKDPEQLYLGDCYLLAAMSSVAHMTPEAIDKLFKKLPGGKYEVTLYSQRGRPQKVIIDADLPRNNWYGYVYARARDPKELWPALLEKAFAKRAGGYPKIDGGLSSEAMTALTGKKSVDTLTRGNRITEQQMFDKIHAAVKAKKPITASTYGESSADKYEGRNIFADHTYAILGTVREGGKDYVKMRNPWGNTEPSGNGRDDGIFKVDMATFMDLMWGISVNG